MIYLIGSLKNPVIPDLANQLRKEGYDVYDEWWCPGPEADDHWQAYEKTRGRSFAEALKGHHAREVYAIDKGHLDQSEACVLVLPAGKSGHLELGYMIGQGKKGYILLDKEPERYDIMYGFANGVFTDVADLLTTLQG